MAEVFGVIASGVSNGALAGQIASSMMKLKTYLDQVRDAPEDIKILIDEIESLHLLLSDIEDDQSHEIAVDFEGLKPMKRKLVSAKIIWKRDKIEKYRAELASDVRLLSLSCQIYTRSLVQLQPDIITSRVTQLMQIKSAHITSIDSPPSSSTGLVQGPTSSMRMNRAGESSRSRQIQSTWLRWKLHSWVLGRAWDLEICRSQQGWKFSISAYAVVSFDSPVVEYTMDGNIEALQRIFSQGEASPFTAYLETNPWGTIERTLLERAAEGEKFKLCEFLINQGADAAYSDDSSKASLDWL